MNTVWLGSGFCFVEPEFRLALLAWTTAAAVQTGTLGGDTMRRLHVAHSLWTKGEPTVSLERHSYRTPNAQPLHSSVEVGSFMRGTEWDRALSCYRSTLSRPAPPGRSACTARTPRGSAIWSSLTWRSR